jgi:hypothetical protein
MTINLHDESQIRRCRKHSVYFVKDDGTHDKCDSYALTWSEVIYYLDRLDTIKSTVGELRRLFLI